MVNGESVPAWQATDAERNYPTSDGRTVKSGVFGGVPRREILGSVRDLVGNLFIVHKLVSGSIKLNQLSFDGLSVEGGCFFVVD